MGFNAYDTDGEEQRRQRKFATDRTAAPTPSQPMTTEPQLPEMALQQARELHRYYLTEPSKPYTAGVLADCIATIENLQQQVNSHASLKARIEELEGEADVLRRAAHELGDQLASAAKLTGGFMVESRSTGTAEALRLLNKIVDLIDNEDANDPLDDAISYAQKAIAALGVAQTGPVVDELRERLADAKAKATETAKISLNSYGAGYDLGYHDALGEFLEFIEDTTPQPASIAYGSRMQEVLDFLNSIEGAGYGGMASFEIVRGHVRDIALSSTTLGGADK